MKNILICKMKDLNNFINEEQTIVEGNAINELTIDDWRLLGAIVDDLRGDLKHNLDNIRKKEDLKALYTKILNVYKSIKK